VGSIVVIIALVATAVWLDIEANPAPAVCASELTGLYRNSSVIATVAKCQSTLHLEANSFYAYELLPFNDRMSLLGGFVAGESVGAYLLNSSEISVLDENPHPTAPPPSYFWSSGVSSNYSIAFGVPAPPNQFYLVVENLNGQSVDVRWAEPLELVVVNNR